MSAITGIFYRDGRKVKLELIKKINDKLSHRGPDGSEVWVDGSVALGHQMLWTTSESLHEKLPFYDEKAGLIITADARIDNRKELSEELKIENKVDVSDSYYILKSYEKWGEKCPEYLLGDFAFAIWDENEEKLFCARDHMGVKPFYYYLSDEIFVFSTEIKALFIISEVPNYINELKVAYYLMQVFTDKKLTFYKNIFSLTAAYSLTIGKNNKRKQKYWEIDQESKIIMNSEEDYINAFRNIFAEAVNCRLRSAFPIGFELSGGLDSSSVVCMAKDILKNKNSCKDEVNTYSMIFDDIPQADESYYINKVVNSEGINSHFIRSDRISPLEKMESYLYCQDQPFYTINMAILSNMYKKMQKDNMRIIIGGSGGDEIISHGANYLRDLAVTFKWKKLINEIYNTSKHSKHNFSNLLLQLVLIPLIPTTLKKFLIKILYLVKNNEKEDFILNKNFTKINGSENYLKSLSFTSLINEAKTARKHHYFMISRFSHQYTLEMQDRIAAAFSIENRHPFFDKRLVEFCYSIPDDMKFRSGWVRYIHRISMENILPKEIQWRHSKKFFTPVLQKNFLIYEKNILNEIFSTDNSLLDKYINLDIIEKIYNKYKSTNKSENLRELWLVTILYLWLKDHTNFSKTN